MTSLAATSDALSYDAGNAVTLTATLTNAAGAFLTPSAVTLRVLDPLGNETDTLLSSLTVVSSGVYSFTLTAITAGIWSYRWESTGTVIAAKDVTFLVTPTIFTSPA